MKESIYNIFSLFLTNTQNTLEKIIGLNLCAVIVKCRLIDLNDHTMYMQTQIERERGKGTLSAAKCISKK